MRFIKYASSSSFLWKKEKKEKNFLTIFLLGGLCLLRFIKYSSSSSFLRKKKKKYFFSFYYSLEGGGLLRLIKYSFSSFLRKKKKKDFFSFYCSLEGGGSFEINQIFFFFFFPPEEKKKKFFSSCYSLEGGCL